MLDERAQRVTDIARQVVTRINPAAVPDLPHLLAHLRDVAKQFQRGQARSLRTLAALDAFLDLEREMPLDLLVEFAGVWPHDATLRPLRASSRGQSRGPIATSDPVRATTGPCRWP